jgi:hypothetical protein
MALPMIAAGIAARAVAKKLASRATGGITGAGAKSINPTYKQQLVSKAKKEAAVYTTGAVATTGWVGSEMYKSVKRYKKTK